MPLDRRTFLAGVAATLASAALPRTFEASTPLTTLMRVRYTIPPIQHANSKAAWFRTVPFMRGSRWRYQALADGDGAIRNLASGDIFFLTPQPGSFWRKAAYHLYEEGTAIDDLPPLSREAHLIARAASHIGSLVGFRKEPGESVTAWFDGPLPWTGALLTHLVASEPAPPLVLA